MTDVQRELLKELTLLDQSISACRNVRDSLPTQMGHPTRQDTWAVEAFLTKERLQTFTLFAETMP
jgi:hypothetical protein